MNRPDVHDYRNPREYLLAELAHRRRVNPRYSLRAWSRQLGYKNPSYLSNLLSGKRRLSPELAPRLAQSLKLAPAEARFFELLVLYDSAKTVAQREIYLELLRSTDSKLKVDDLLVDQFHVIKEWYHLAILEMFDLKDFVPDAKWIAERLGHHLTPATVELALDRLKRQRLVRSTKGGSLRRATPYLRIGNDLPNEAIRAHHLQYIEHAKEALEQQSVDERYVSGSTFAIRRRDLAKITKLVSDFHQKLVDVASEPIRAGEKGDAVYRFNTQLFRVTD